MAIIRNITTGNTFIMGHKSFENGRLETVLVAQAAATDSESVLVVS